MRIQREMSRRDMLDDLKTLYITSRVNLMSVNVKIAGLPVPAQKKS